MLYYIWASHISWALLQWNITVRIKIYFWIPKTWILHNESITCVSSNTRKTYLGLIVNWNLRSQAFQCWSGISRIFVVQIWTLKPFVLNWSWKITLHFVPWASFFFFFFAGKILWLLISGDLMLILCQSQISMLERNRSWGLSNARISLFLFQEQICAFCPFTAVSWSLPHQSREVLTDVSKALPIMCRRHKPFQIRHSSHTLL